MLHYRNILFCLLLTVLIAGCSNKVKIHGTVVFDDDESPLTVGTVLLQSNTYSAKGDIQADGSFQISSVKKNDGVPPGVYRVTVTGAIKWPESPANTSNLPPDQQTGISPAQDAIPLIHSRYTSAQTSGITYDTAKDTVLNIRVERAGKK